MKFKFDCGLIARSLIALVFVLAGFSKLKLLMSSSADLYSSMPVPESVQMIVALLVIFIEIPLAIAYAVGFKYVKAGWALIGFTVLATVLVHVKIYTDLPMESVQGKFLQMNMILKNIAIVGGILATIGCYCGKCLTCSVKEHKGDHNHHNA